MRNFSLVTLLFSPHSPLSSPVPSHPTLQRSNHTPPPPLSPSTPSPSLSLPPHLLVSFFIPLLVSSLLSSTVKFSLIYYVVHINYVI